MSPDEILDLSIYYIQCMLFGSIMGSDYSSATYCTVLYSGGTIVNRTIYCFVF